MKIYKNRHIILFVSLFCAILFSCEMHDAKDLEALSKDAELKTSYVVNSNSRSSNSQILYPYYGEYYQPDVFQTNDGQNLGVLPDHIIAFAGDDNQHLRKYNALYIQLTVNGITTDTEGELFVDVTVLDNYSVKVFASNVVNGVAGDLVSVSEIYIMEDIDHSDQETLYWYRGQLPDDIIYEDNDGVWTPVYPEGTFTLADPDGDGDYSEDISNFTCTCTSGTGCIPVKSGCLVSGCQACNIRLEHGGFVNEFEEVSGIIYFFDERPYSN